MQGRSEPKVYGVAWGTGHELAFIDGLGAYSKNEGLRVGRRALLQGYAGAMLGRNNWGSVDRDRVLRHVASALARSTP